MTRFAENFKANKNTLFGLSGLDLILTCNSESSKYSVGIKIASAKNENILIY